MGMEYRRKGWFGLGWGGVGWRGKRGGEGERGEQGYYHTVKYT